MSRRLNPDEQALWAKVAATIRPLSRDAADPERIAIAAPPPIPAPRIKGRIPPERTAPAAPPPTKSLQNATLDGSWDKKLRSGSIQPDRVLDLHGHTLDGAWHAIDQTLDRAIAAGDRVVLLVTGHERKGAPHVERGKIRAVVNDWLAHSRHGRAIAAVRGAHRRHGGGGSLYIILRRG